MAAGKKIEIKLVATGGQQAAQQVSRVGAAMKDLGKQADIADEKIDQSAKTNNTFTGSAVNMRGAVSNLAFQLQDMAVQAEMGVSPLRIISQQVPQLLGGFGAFGAISGAAIGLGVPLAASLFKIGDGAADSASSISKLNESLDGLQEAYAEIYKLIGEDQEEAAKKAAQRVAETIKGINTQVSVDTDAASLQAAKEKAESQLKLTQDRIRLAELEKQVATATGTDALRLAKEREATIRRIFDTELQISEIARKQAMAAAQAKVAGAGQTLGQQTAASQTAAQELSAAQEKQNQLLADLQNLINQRLQRIQEIEAELNRRFEASGPVSRLEDPLEFNARQSLREERDRLNVPSTGEQNIAAEAAAQQALLNQIKAQSDTASAAQQAAADAMNEAVRALLNLRENQDVSRRSEAELKATEEIGRVGQDVTQAALDAIEQIKANAAGQGRAVNPGEQEAISGIQSLVNDTTPDAEQGGQLAGLLQMLANNLNAKDNILAAGIETLIQNAVNSNNRFKSLTDRINQVNGMARDAMTTASNAAVIANKALETANAAKAASQQNR